jgi:hypothetical protein
MLDELNLLNFTYWAKPAFGGPSTRIDGNYLPIEGVTAHANKRELRRGKRH